MPNYTVTTFDTRGTVRTYAFHFVAAAVRTFRLCRKSSFYTRVVLDRIAR